MIRWIRLAAIGALVVSLVVVGVGVGLFLVSNNSWFPLEVHFWLTDLVGDPNLEMWVPALIAGWLLAIMALLALLLLSMFYVWRRRQYEALIGRLERELTVLRNLPFTAPAPLEDLPETPDAAAAQLLAEPDVFSRAEDSDGDALQ